MHQKPHARPAKKHPTRWAVILLYITLSLATGSLYAAFVKLAGAPWGWATFAWLIAAAGTFLSLCVVYSGSYL